MQRVVNVSLNGNAYVLEEEGHAAVRRYLDEAARQLAADPDRAEILADLEQAIADKCARHLSPGKNVVTAAEMEQALEEMGPVGSAQQGTSAATAPGGARTADGGATAPTPPEATPHEAPRRLYRILETGMLGGICSGIGAYVRLDANVVRAIFVVLVVLTYGAWILVYLVLLFVIPPAGTAEERAAAHGLPFSAQDLVDQAKRQYARLGRELRGARAGARRRREWRRQWRREWRAAWRAGRGAPPGAVAPAATYGEQIAAGFVVPVLAMLSAGLTVAWFVAAAMLVRTGAILGWTPGLPLWGALLALVLVVGILGGPIHHARHALQRDAWIRAPLLAAWDGLLWVAFLVLFAWIAWRFSPEVRELVHDLPGAVLRVRASLP